MSVVDTPSATVTPSPPESAVNARVSGGAARKYIRGSGLLLGGRFISILLNLAIQVLTVRYLSKAEYGAFAYALGIVSISTSVILLGLGKTLPRFVPIYHERGDYARTFGTIALAVCTVWGLGLSLVVLLFGLRGIISGTVITDPVSLSLLLILIALAPIGAFDNLLQKLVAVFASARAVFLRRHVLGPLLKLTAVLIVILTAGDVYLLAYGYLAGGLIGVWLYVTILIREWRKQDLLQHMRPRTLTLPVRDVFGYSIPLLSAELPVIVRGSLAIILLEYFHTTAAVAEYRAILPVAGLNMIVFEAFGLLFVPLASRMFARNDKNGISDVYWKTCIWITVLTFPVFAVTCSLARPLTVMLFGEAYETAAPLLALMAFGFYFHAALGFNAATLRVYGKIRYSVSSDIFAAVIFVVMCLVLIPPYGALGAAIGTTATLIAHNIFNQIGLWIAGTGVRPFEWRFASVYFFATLMMLSLLLMQWLVSPHISVSLILAGTVSLCLVRITRHVVNPEEVFPELLRIPLVRRLLT
jgi:O-antigen/teichoic acid export membrane protein